MTCCTPAYLHVACARFRGADAGCELCAGLRSAPACMLCGNFTCTAATTFLLALHAPGGWYIGWASLGLIRQTAASGARDAVSLHVRSLPPCVAELTRSTSDNSKRLNRPTFTHSEFVCATCRPVPGIPPRCNRCRPAHRDRLDHNHDQIILTFRPRRAPLSKPTRTYTRQKVSRSRRPASWMTHIETSRDLCPPAAARVSQEVRCALKAGRTCRADTNARTRKLRSISTIAGGKRGAPRAKTSSNMEGVRETDAAPQSLLVRQSGPQSRLPHTDSLTRAQARWSLHAHATEKRKQL